jgi:catechol 2,3-dioxygenase-like lactoylglutathione lyase family enzyme
VRFNRLIPEISVTDIEESLRFYTEILGFEVEYSRPEDGFAFLSLQGSQLMVEEINHNWETGELERPYGRGVNLQIEVDGVEELLRSLEEQGYPLFRPLKESWYRGDDVVYGQKEFLVQDPDGYLLRFAHDLGKKPET